MASHRRRASTGPDGGQFTFASSPGGLPGGRESAHGVGYGAWAERIRGSRGYFGKSDDLKFGAWKRGGALSFGGYESVEEDFRWLVREEEEDDGSDTPSPPLWKNAGSPATDARSRHVDADIYPTSRAREIARYRQEMLEMVKNLPESDYELSLRDMVVQPATPPRMPPRTPKAGEERLVKGKGSPAKAGGKDHKRMDKSMRQLSRSESMETGGFLLKMFTPVALGGVRRKNTSSGSNSRAKVSPRPSFEADKGSSEGRYGDWWKKSELSGSGGSNSSKTSNTSSSSSHSNTSSGSCSSVTSRSRKMNGCYPFLLRNKK